MSGRRHLRWLRPPWRLRVTTSGALFLTGSLGVGVAAVNTANNLLYLLLGAMLGFVAASGWLSERMLRGLRIRRRLSAAATVGRPIQIAYEVTNEKRLLASYALTLVERGRRPAAFLLAIGPGESRLARATHVFSRRGLHLLERVTLETAFPFGFFRKSRSVEVPGALLVRPRSDLRVRRPRPGGEVGGGWQGEALARAGARGEYRSLREYRAGDDPRDVHWRSSARLTAPVVREYDREDSRSLWICVDLAHAPSGRVERTIEVAASLAAAAAARGDRFALAVPGGEVPPGMGPGNLERVLDALARVQPSERAPQLLPPVDRTHCVLITPGPGPGGEWADVLLPEDASEPESAAAAPEAEASAGASAAELETAS